MPRQSMIFPMKTVVLVNTSSVKGKKKKEKKIQREKKLGGKRQ